MFGHRYYVTSPAVFAFKARSMKKGLCALLVLLVGLAPLLASAQTGSATQPVEVFKKLEPKQRFEAALRLMALGHYQDKLGEFNAALVKGVRTFQRSARLPATGALDPATLKALHRAADPIVSYFGLKDITHPATRSVLAVPARLVDRATNTRRGLYFESNSGDVTVDFSFMPREQSSLNEIYARLAADGTLRKVVYKNIEDGFFIVTGIERNKAFVIRYNAIAGGSVGFTLKFDPVRVKSGDRLAILMGALFEPIPRKAPGQPQPGPGGNTPQHAGAGKPPAPSTVTQTGSGFFITTDGMGVTNHHVVHGCTEARIVGFGAAQIVALDRTNDMALLKLANPATTKSVEIRRKPLRLGETIYALGFPLAGQLDNGLNFTAGVVSSLAGPGNDTRTLQFTAPIQPGNSGGPLIDESGALIGVVRAKFNDITALKTIGIVPQNVNFGIKSDMLLSFLSSNQIEAAAAAEQRPQLPPAEIAALGRERAFQVMCTAKREQPKQ